MLVLITSSERGYKSHCTIFVSFTINTMSVLGFRLP